MSDPTVYDPSFGDVDPEGFIAGMTAAQDDLRTVGEGLRSQLADGVRDAASELGVVEHTLNDRVDRGTQRSVKELLRIDGQSRAALDTAVGGLQEEFGALTRDFRPVAVLPVPGLPAPVVLPVPVPAPVLGAAVCPPGSHPVQTATGPGCQFDLVAVGPSPAPPPGGPGAPAPAPPSCPPCPPAEPPPPVCPPPIINIPPCPPVTGTPPPPPPPDGEGAGPCQLVRPCAPWDTSLKDGSAWAAGIDRANYRALYASWLGPLRGPVMDLTITEHLAQLDAFAYGLTGGVQP